MRFNLNRFSKYFLAVLLAASLCMAGCSNNPSGANTSTETETSTGTGTGTGTEVAKYSITGQITSTFISSKASFVVILKDSENKTSGKSNGAAFSFTDLKTGSYVLTAVDNSGLYKMQSEVPVILDGDKKDIKISMLYTGTVPTFNFVGNLIDSLGKDVCATNVTLKDKASNIEDKTATSKPDSGEFGFIGICPGKYELSVAESSSIACKFELSINEEGDSILFNNIPVTNKKSFTPATTGTAVECLDLGNLTLSPNFGATGALYGKILDPSTGSPIAQGSIVYLYKKTLVEPSLVAGFKIKSDAGYFSVTNLQAGEYAASKIALESGEWKTSTDSQGNVNYEVPAENQYFSWITVREGESSKIPSFE